MTHPTRMSWLQRLFRRAPDTEEDAADLGTAFGLDFVLDEQAPPAPLPGQVWSACPPVPGAPPQGRPR